MGLTFNFNINITKRVNIDELPEVVTAVWSPEWKKKLEWNHSLLQSSLTGDGDKLRILNFLFFSVSPYSLPRLAQHLLEGRSIFFENIGIRADRNDEYVFLVNELSNEIQRIGKGILLRLIANVADDFLRRQYESEEMPDESSEESDSDCSTEDVNRTILEMKERILNAYKISSLRSIALKNVLKVNKQIGHSVLHAAGIEGDSDKVRETKSNMSNLQNAVCANNVEKVIQLVCEENQDVEEAGANGIPPLVIAAASGNLEMVRTLIDLGASSKLAVETKSVSMFTKKMTPLMSACYYNNYNAAKIILERGAPIDIYDETGRTALYFAVAMRNTKVAQMLLQHSFTTKQNE